MPPTTTTGFAAPAASSTSEVGSTLSESSVAAGVGSEAATDFPAMDSLLDNLPTLSTLPTGTPTNPNDPRITTITEQLSARGIAFMLHHHAALDTVEACKAYRDATDATANPHFGYCKNLFVRDKRGARYLIVAHEDTTVHMPHARRVLNAARSFSMTTPAELLESLGVLPGCVSPLALLTDFVRPAGERTVSGVLLDRSLFAEKYSHLFFHPLVNTASIGLSPASLLSFLQELGVPVLLDAMSEGQA